MAKILNSMKLSGNITKLLETPDSLVINGQVYDKTTFNAKALDFCPANVSSRNEMILSNMVHPEGVWVHNRSEQGMIRDSSDPNVFYFATTGRYLLTGTINKVQKIGNGYNTASVNIPGGANNDIVEFIGQDNNRVYFTLQRNQMPDSYGHIGSVDKTTFAITYVNLGNVGPIKKIKETESFFYLFCSWMNRASITKFNKMNQSISTIYDEAIAGVNLRSIPSEIDDSGVFYLAIDGYTNTVRVSKTMYRKYTLDTSRDTVSFVECGVDYAHKENKSVPLTGVGGDSARSEVFITKDGNERYLTHVIYNNGWKALAVPSDRSCLHTYKILPSGDLKLVSWTDFVTVVYKGMTSLYENKLILLATENGIHFFNWNRSTESFDRTGAYDCQLFCFGYDQTNNIYVQLQDSSVEMISNTLPTTIYADFEYENYSYEGTDVDASLEIYTKNFFGDFLSSNIELQLSGPVRFAETGLKTKRITTSTSNKLIVPVIISGEGMLKVTPKVI